MAGAALMLAVAGRFGYVSASRFSMEHRQRGCRGDRGAAPAARGRRHLPGNPARSAEAQPGSVQQHLLRGKFRATGLVRRATGSIRGIWRIRWFRPARHCRLPDRTNSQRGSQGHALGDVVRPKARHSGLGRRLVEAVITDASRCVELIQLTVGGGNEPARRLYASLGFTEYGFEKNSLKQDGRYWDEVLMARPLLPAEAARS